MTGKDPFLLDSSPAASRVKQFGFEIIRWSAPVMLLAWLYRDDLRSWFVEVISYG